VAAFTSCHHEVKAPAPSATPATASAGVVSAPVDPVGYTSAGEADRLARLDAEDAARVQARRARIDRLTALRHEQQREEEEGGGLGGLTGIGHPLFNNACNACGRG